MADKKTFKTYKEQIAILKSRNLIVDNESEAIRFLELNNYYNVINGYKKPFLKANMPEEQFMDNVHFQDVVQLYKADKALSSLFFQEIIRIERMIKSIIAYQFTSQYGIEYDNGLKGGDYIYITPHFFNPDPNFQDSIKDFCTSLSATRNSCIEKRHDGRIIHYSNNGYIPFWVFVNVMSLGATSLFYQYMKPTDQSNVCEQLFSALQRNENYKIEHNDTQNSLKIITYIRNLCAHDQRLFDFATKSTLTSSNLLVSKLPANKISGVVIAAAAVSQFCTVSQFNGFYNKLLRIISDLLNFYKNIDLKKRIIKELKLSPILSDMAQLQ